MTLNELRESVLSLGFEDGFDREELFNSAVKRALYTISCDRPEVKERSFMLLSPLGRLICAAFVHTGGDFETFSIKGRAYSFKVAGDGYYTVRDQDGERTAYFGGGTVTVSGFIRGEATMTFGGECDYLVFSLSSFDRQLSKNASDIPIYGDKRSISLPEIFPDYLSAHRLPYDKFGFEICDAEIKGNVLTLPYNFTGEIIISYKRRASLPSFDDGEEKIDVHSECEELLPLLVAFYVWLDDDSDKAEIYLSLYKDMLSSLKKSNQRLFEPRYLTNGWA